MTVDSIGYFNGLPSHDKNSFGLSPSSVVFDFVEINIIEMAIDIVYWGAADQTSDQAGTKSIRSKSSEADALNESIHRGNTSPEFVPGTIVSPQSIFLVNLTRCNAACGGDAGKLTSICCNFGIV